MQSHHSASEPFWAVCFWASALLIAHTYALYPLILLLIDSVRPRRPDPPPAASDPTVTVIVPLFNEEAVIEAKIRNLAQTDYPADKLNVLLGSDGSTDRTNAILSSGQWNHAPRFVLFPSRRGKAAVLNDLVAAAQGEIIVFSDANATFAPETIRRLTAPFAAPDVGAAARQLILHRNHASPRRGRRPFRRGQKLLHRPDN